MSQKLVYFKQSSNQKWGLYAEIKVKVEIHGQLSNLIKENPYGNFRVILVLKMHQK